MTLTKKLHQQDIDKLVTQILKDQQQQTSNKPNK